MLLLMTMLMMLMLIMIMLLMLLILMVVGDLGEILMLPPQEATMLPAAAADLHRSVNHDLFASKPRQNETNSQEKRHS